MITEDSTSCKTANFVIKLMESKINTVNTRLDNVEKQLSTHCTLFESKFEELKEQRDTNNIQINKKLDKIIEKMNSEDLRINGLEMWKKDTVEPSLKEIDSLKQMKWKMLGIVSFLVFITPIIYNIIVKLLETSSK